MLSAAGGHRWRVRGAERGPQRIPVFLPSATTSSPNRRDFSSSPKDRAFQAANVLTKARLNGLGEPDLLRSTDGLVLPLLGLDEVATGSADGRQGDQGHGDRVVGQRPEGRDGLVRGLARKPAMPISKCAPAASKSAS